MVSDGALDMAILERRSFQLTSIGGNNNKFYHVTFFDDGTATVHWGRVGSSGETQNVGHGTAWSRIDGKLRKGYVEIELNTPVMVSGVQSVGAAEDQLVDWIFREANERIGQTLAVALDELSPKQIARGRGLITDFAAKQARSYHVQDLGQVLEEYYNTIPTRLPSKLDMLELISSFDPASEETRLDQLEAGLTTTIAVQSGNSQYAALGVQLKWLDPSSEDYRTVKEYIAKTAGNAYRIDGIYTVKIPAERDAFEDNLIGTNYITSLYHGTRNPNIRHILKSGLRVPNHNQVSNGSRFGRGIYFADKAQRSMNYTASTGNIPRMMFIADVALGKQAKLAGDDQRLTAPPSGYDSVWGVQAHSGMDEFIIYRAPQQTIRFIVTFR